MKQDEKALLWLPVRVPMVNGRGYWDAVIIAVSEDQRYVKVHGSSESFGKDRWVEVVKVSANSARVTRRLDDWIMRLDEVGAARKDRETHPVRGRKIQTGEL
jgi:hypothetical protein